MQIWLISTQTFCKHVANFIGKQKRQKKQKFQKKVEFKIHFVHIEFTPHKRF